MRLRMLLTGIVALAVGLAPATAGAKGASKVTISGAGLAKPIELGSTTWGPTSQQAATLAQAAGVYVAMSTATPDPNDPSSAQLQSTRPPGRRGARYDATFTLSPDGRIVLRQRLYPFASAGPLTYTPPQTLFGTQPIRGGWHRAPSELQRVLLAAGVPGPARPAASPGSRAEATVDRRVVVATLVGAAVILLVLAMVVRRRRRFPVRVAID